MRRPTTFSTAYSNEDIFSGDNFFLFFTKFDDRKTHTVHDTVAHSAEEMSGNVKEKLWRLMSCHT